MTRLSALCTVFTTHYESIIISNKKVTKNFAGATTGLNHTVIGCVCTWSLSAG